MTSKELKKILDQHIESSRLLNGSILLSVHLYEKAWHSCTTDESDFKIIKGKVFYKGFQLFGAGA